MTVMDFGTGLGLERIGKEALSLLRRDLNTEIQSQETGWDDFDREYGFVPTQLELVEEGNFFHGHVPSLVEAPSERFPNVAVLCFRSQPAVESAALDHENIYADTMFVETMVKSWTDEQELNSRTLRTVDAIHAVLVRYEAIGGAHTGAGAPTVFVTDVGHRPETRGHGRAFYYQGARLEYTLQKYVVLGR